MRQSRVFRSYLVALTSILVSCGLLEPSEKNNGSPQPGETCLTNCDDPTPEINHPSKVERAGLLLRSFENCEAAETYYEEQLILQLRAQVKQQIEWHSKSRSYDGPQPASEAANSAAGDAENSTAKSAPDNYTTTNNQVAGVEESDFIKNTGTHIFQASGTTVQIIQSWPVSEMKSIGKIEFKGKPFQLMLSESRRLMVLYHPEGVAAHSGRWGEMESDVALPSRGEEYKTFDHQRVFVETYDVKDPASPKLLGKYALGGSFVQARRVGESVRLILQSQANWPEKVEYPSPYEDGRYRPLSKEEYAERMNASLAKAEEEISKQNIEFWLQQSSYVKVDLDGGEKPAMDLQSCSNVHAPRTPSDLNLSRVITINMDSDSVKQTVLMSSASQVYASKESLYLVTPFYWWNDRDKDTDYSYVHMFDITDPVDAGYLGSGGIEGIPLNQFSLDEHNDHLRIAATVTSYPKYDDNGSIVRNWRQETVNRVYVMKLADQKLEVVGQTQDLAKGERVYSARFNGDRGFVVTFRQVDPLFTLDLSNPTEPKVVGELKIPGFSSYIHMMDDQHLLTVGQDATDQGRVRGVKVSIFDVSEMAHPKELRTYTLPAGTWSEANWDHKAFTYFAAKKLLAIPVTGYSYSSGSFSKLMVLNVDPAAEISSKGSVDVSELVSITGAERYWWYGAAQIRRSIFADDFVYAISNIGVKAVNVQAIDQTAGKVQYECQGSCLFDWYWY